MIAGAEDQLSTMTHAHMTDVRVWLPGASVNSDHLRVWLKRYGTSQVYDQQGNSWTFTHGARTMLYDYSTKDHSHISPRTPRDNYKENTRVEIDEDKSDYVALSPIGPWSLSVSKRYNPGVDTSKVDAIYLQLSHSFLPCAQPECPIRPLNTTKSSSDGPAPKKQEDGKHDAGCCGQAGTIVGIILGVLILIGIVVLIVVYIKRPKLYTQLGGTYNSI